MKKVLLRLCPLLLLVPAGCINQGYGPASPDYYPVTSPPFLNLSDPGATPTALPAQRAETVIRKDRSA